jgi:hypothetical protein
VTLSPKGALVVADVAHAVAETLSAQPAIASKIKAWWPLLRSEEGHVPIELFTHTYLCADHFVDPTSDPNPDALALHF